eukprot:77546_1
MKDKLKYLFTNHTFCKAFISTNTKTKGILTANQAIGEYLYGPHAVYAALINKKRSNYHRLYVAKTSERKDCKIIKQCHDMEVAITYISKFKLAKMISLHRHNGFVLDCDPIRCDPIENNPIQIDHTSNKPQIWLAMEQARTQDNVGSILRSCLYFGVDGILYSTLQAAPLSPIVARTSCGALDWSDIRLCSKQTLNEYLMDIRRDYRDKNIQIIGLDMFENDSYNQNKKRININDVCDKINAQTTLIVIVVGNEGFGLSEEVRKECDYLAYIKRFDTTPEYIDSLSVNVAVSVALHRIVSNVNNCHSHECN